VISIITVLLEILFNNNFYSCNCCLFLSFSIYTSEDVSVGAWLSPLNITRKHDRRFDTEWVSRGCRNDYLVTHKSNPKLMRLHWSNIIQTGKMCNKEVKYMDSHEYNWSVMPSKCCVKNSSLFP